jgi:hypothetical protein
MGAWRFNRNTGFLSLQDHNHTLIAARKVQWRVYPIRLISLPVLTNLVMSIHEVLSTLQCYLGALFSWCRWRVSMPAPGSSAGSNGFNMGAQRGDAGWAAFNGGTRSTLFIEPPCT